MSTAERIRLPDDCTIGYIVEALLGVPLIRSRLFHSHLESLQQVPASELHEQVAYRGRQPRGGGQARLPRHPDVPAGEGRPPACCLQPDTSALCPSVLSRGHSLAHS